MWDLLLETQKDTSEMFQRESRTRLHCKESDRPKKASALQGQAEKEEWPDEAADALVNMPELNTSK